MNGEFLSIDTAKKIAKLEKECCKNIRKQVGGYKWTYTTN